MLCRMLALAGLAALVMVPGAGAQSRWSAEVDADVAVPTAKLAGAELTTGAGVGANVRFRMQPHLAVYGGWEYQHFGIEDADDADLDHTGYTFGLRFEHPFGSRLSYWLRAGGTASHLEFEDGDGDLISDTGHGLGYELGGGLVVPVGARLRLTPGVRFRSLTRDIELAGGKESGTLSYLAAGVGVQFSF